jgi:enoyl-CoA hydratase/carnithine racemase
MNDDILLDKTDGAIWTITLNRPQAKNAITMDMAARLMQNLSEAETDAHARCIIITGAGDAFSAGFDIKEMSGFDEEAMRDAFVKRDPLFKAVAMHPLPIIAAVNGIAYGAGALIAAASDFRLAGPKAAFKVTAINYGSANATWSLPKIVGLSKAKHILMTGRAVMADEGFAIGLFDEITKGDVVQTARDLAANIATKAKVGITAAKFLTNASLYSTTENAWKAEFDHVLDQLNRSQSAGNAIFDNFLKSRS